MRRLVDSRPFLQRLTDLFTDRIAWTSITIDIMPIFTGIAAYLWFGWHGFFLVVLLKSSLRYTRRF